MRTKSVSYCYYYCPPSDVSNESFVSFRFFVSLSSRVSSRSVSDMRPPPAGGRAKLTAHISAASIRN